MNVRLYIRLIIFVCLTLLIVAPAVDAQKQDSLEAGIDSFLSGLDSLKKGDLSDAEKSLLITLKEFQSAKFSKGQFLAHLSLAKVYRRLGQYKNAEKQLDMARDGLPGTDIRGKCLELLRRAELEIDRSQFDLAEEYLEKGREPLKLRSDLRLEAMINIRRGTIHAVRGKYNTATKLLSKAKEHFRNRDDDPVGKAEVLMQLGRINRDLSQYKQSRELLQKAFITARKAGNGRLEHRVAVEQGLTLAQLGEIRPGIERLMRAIDYFKKHGYKRQAAGALTNLKALILMEGPIAEPGRHLQDLEQAYKTLEGFSAGLEQAETLFVQGAMLIEVGQLTKAVKSLKKALDLFVQKKILPGEMHTRMALARVSAIQGRRMSAVNNADQALNLARKLTSPQGIADAYFTKGLVEQYQGNFSKALSHFDKAFELNEKLKNREKLKNLQTTAKCLIKRAEVLTELGFIHQATNDANDLSKRTYVTDNLNLQLDLELLLGMIAHARGDDKKALAEYKIAEAVFKNLPSPFDRARIMEAKAKAHETLRNIIQAEAYWKQAQKEYAQLPSPEGTLRCIAARMDIALARDDIAGAEKILASGRSQFQKQVKLITPSELCADTTIQSNGGRRKRDDHYAIAANLLGAFHIYLAQLEGPSGPYSDGFGSYTPRVPTFPLTQPTMDVKDDADSTILRARWGLLEALVAIARGDAASAERYAVKAVEVAKNIIPDRAVAQFMKILGEVYAAKGQYSPALKAFRNSGLVREWRLAHIEAMALVEKGDLRNSIQAFEKSCERLAHEENRYGLWHVSPRKAEQRIQLYADYLDTLMTAVTKKKSPSLEERAWRVAQNLKLKRVYYDMTAIGAYRFPGVPESTMLRLKGLQYGAFNEAKRQKYGKLKVHSSSIIKSSPHQDTESPLEGLKKAEQQLNTHYQPYIQYMRGTGPSVRDVQDRLTQGEFYVSFVITQRAIHRFVIGQKGILDVRVISTDPAGVEKALQRVERALQRQNYRIDRTANELWHIFIGNPPDSAKKIVFEVDGFLTTFPFEALIPGEFPKTPGEQHAVEMLMDRFQVLRTTSALRFVKQRSQALLKSEHGSSLAAYTVQDLPNKVTSSPVDHLTEHLWSSWKKDLLLYDKSALFKTTHSAAAMARIFPSKGQLFRQDRASRTSFLDKGLKKYSFTYVECPVLLPSRPIGAIDQPFLVFSFKRNDLAAGFCGVTTLMEETSSTELIALGWLSDSQRSNGRALTMLLEAFRHMGIRDVLLPLWNPPAYAKDEYKTLMESFFTSIRDGKDASTALKHAQAGLKTELTQRNRLIPAILAVY